MAKIYTKTGDRGTTGTLKGRMAKSDLLAEALGVVDELNSWLGLCRARCGEFGVQCNEIGEELRKVQRDLLVLGSGMAGSGLKLGGSETKRLEKIIDKLTDDLPKLANFILPTGVGPAGYLQIARTVARRAERRIVAAEVKDKSVLKYVNRLSDVLFTFARWVNWKLGGFEEVWRG